MQPPRREPPGLTPAGRALPPATGRAPASDPWARRHWLWRALAWFWLLVGLALAGTLGTLAWLGAPPETAPRVLVPPHPESPAPGAPPATSSVPEPPANAAPPATASTPAPPATTSTPPPPATTSTPPPPAATPAPAPPAQTPAPAPPAEAPVAPPAPAAAPPAPPDAPEPPPLPADEAQAAAHRIPPPEPALLQQSAAGPLPRIGADGTEPRQAYARPFDRADTRPRIALLARAPAEPALRRLPPETALAFAHPAPTLLEEARARGMETLLLLPAAPEQGLIEPLLARFAGYVGALGAPDGRPDATFQQALRQRGLLYLDPAAGPPLQAWGRAADLRLEDAPTRGEIDRQLAALEQRARENGSALGLLPDQPGALWLDRVAAWAAGLPERGLVLAPVTAILRRPDSAPR